MNAVRLGGALALLGASFTAHSCRIHDSAVTHRPAVLTAEPVGSADRSVRMGKPLFVCSTQNWAWGHLSLGHVLDDQGRIWYYELRSSKGQDWRWERTLPSLRTADNLFTEAGLKARFVNPVLQTRRVPMLQLVSMYRRAKRAQHGRIESWQAARDAGRIGCEAYLWPRTNSAHRVELGSWGDATVINLSHDAARLSHWLTIDLGMGHPPWAPPR